MGSHMAFGNSFGHAWRRNSHWCRLALAAASSKRACAHVRCIICVQRLNFKNVGTWQPFCTWHLHLNLKKSISIRADGKTQIQLACISLTEEMNLIHGIFQIVSLIRYISSMLTWDADMNTWMIDILQNHFAWKASPRNQKDIDYRQNLNLKKKKNPGESLGWKQ